MFNLNGFFMHSKLFIYVIFLISSMVFGLLKEKKNILRKKINNYNVSNDLFVIISIILSINLIFYKVIMKKIVKFKMI